LPSAIAYGGECQGFDLVYDAKQFGGWELWLRKNNLPASSVLKLARSLPVTGFHIIQKPNVVLSCLYSILTTNV
jgi:hypothetical protein